MGNENKAGPQEDEKTAMRHYEVGAEGVHRGTHNL